MIKVFVISILFSILLLAIGLFFIQKQNDGNKKKVATLIFLIAFLSHLLFAFFIYYTDFQPFSGGKGDYTDYHIMANAVSERVRDGNFSLQNFQLPFGVSHYYPVIIGYIYAITVPEMIIGQIFNAFVLAMTIMLVYLLVLEIGRSSREGFWVSMIANIYPSFAFFSGIMIKDVMVVFFSILSLLYTIKIINNFSWYKFFILYCALFGLTHFRFYVAYALMATLGICWILFSNLKISKRIGYGLIMFVLLGLLPQITGVDEGYFAAKSVGRYINIKTFQYYREVAYLPNYIKNKADDIVDSFKPEPKNQIIPAGTIDQDNEDRNWGEDSSIVIRTGLNSPRLFVKNTILAFLNMLLGPFPWQILYLKHLFVVPEIIYWYFILFFVIFGVLKHFKVYFVKILPVLLFSLFLLVGFSFFITNFGILTRIRIPAFLSLMCLLPLGFSVLNNIKVPFFEKYFNL